jgi:very-short-patch-repair endonuclease
MRGETTGENSYNYGKKVNHKKDCNCFICRGKRGERKGQNAPRYGKTFEHKENCQCASCKSKRKEKLNHKPNCQCYTCKAVRGETKGENSYFYGKHHTKESKEKSGKSHVKLWQNPKYVVNQRKGRKLKPNKPEKQLNELLQELFPNEYKYVGDFQVIIGSRNPDFINVAGQKKIIELFGDYFHSKKLTKRSRKEEEKQRIDYFSKYGYHTLIIWEHELKDINKLKNKLLRFYNDN